MRRLDYPDIKCHDPFLTCISSVNAKYADYINRMTNISGEVATEWVDFNSRIVSKDLHLISPCKSRNIKQIIISDVKKSELKALYEIHMLKKGSQARKIYDILRASAGGRCPLCGIRDVSTLDHYLPKARYPLHSVNPRNLVPACRDCNTGKLDKIFTNKSEQTLYPYDEDVRFYDEDWICATVESIEGTLVFDFYADPPQNWPNVDRERAINHFKIFNLRKAYTLHASQMVMVIKNAIEMIWEMGGSDAVKDYCRRNITSEQDSPSNRAIFRAIIANENLCNGAF